MNKKKRIKNKQIKKSLQWLLSHAMTVFSCVLIIVLGIVSLVYSSPGTTTIGENISTNNLTASGNLEVGGNATTTGNLVVTGNTSLATTTILGNLDLSLKQLKNAVLENLADFPSNPVEGQMFWSTASSTPYWYDEANSRWKGDISGATFVVAASDSINKEKADYVCDGTDDQVEIQAAIDAASGGKVLLLSGQYNISDTITLSHNGTVLEGLSKRNSILFLANGANCDVIKIDAKNCTLKNFRIYGNKANQTSTSRGVFFVDHHYENQLISLDIEYTYSEGIYIFWGVDRTDVIDCRIAYTKSHGIYISQSSLVNVTGCTFIHCGEANGLTTAIYSSYSTGGLIANNRVYAGNEGFYIKGGTSITLASNSFYSTIRHSVFVGYGSREITITGNASYNPGLECYCVEWESSGGVKNQDITITGNVCRSQKCGIWVSQAEGVNIESNTIYGAGSENGITVRLASYVNVVGNEVNSSSNAGIGLVGAKKCNISNNVIRDSARATGRSDPDINFSGTGSPTVYSTENRIFNNILISTDGESSYGIQAGTGHNDNIIGYNYLHGHGIGSIDVNVTNKVFGNTGYITENSGTATISSSNTYIDISHGLNITPATSTISVVPTNNLGNATKFWVSNVGSSTFRINLNVDPEGNATFSWQIGSY